LQYQQFSIKEIISLEISVIKKQECDMHIIPMTEEEVDDHKVAIWLEKFGPSDNVRSMRHGD